MMIEEAKLGGAEKGPMVPYRYVARQFVGITSGVPQDMGSLGRKSRYLGMQAPVLFGKWHVLWRRPLISHMGGGASTMRTKRYTCTRLCALWSVETLDRHRLHHESIVKLEGPSVAFRRQQGQNTARSTEETTFQC